MAIDCPACGKAAQATHTCARCGADLASLHDVVDSAARLLFAAAGALRRSDWATALNRASRAYHLAKTRDAAQLAFLAASALHDAPAAALWYGHATRHTRSGPQQSG